VHVTRLVARHRCGGEEIATADLGLLSLTDDVDEAVDVIVRISDDT
jgi:hypothetical protein